MRPLIIIALILGFNLSSFSQSKYVLANKCGLRISGTSTLHDWTITAEQMSGHGQFKVNKSTIIDIPSFELEIVAESLKSGKIGMDKNTYKALNTRQHKVIRFKLRDIKKVSNTNSLNEIEAIGDLTVAGNTRRIILAAKCKIDDDVIKCRGSYDLKMTEFKIDPPTAMFGTIKTGNDITIDFETHFIKSNK